MALVNKWRAFAAAPWASNQRLGLGLVIGSALLTVLVAFAGPSSVALDLGPRTGFLPPWYLSAGVLKLSEWVVVPALWLSIAIGGLGLWISNQALRRGWLPNVRKFFALGTLLSTLTALVPPLTSADVLMYAAYGRIQLIGQNPYDITPASIFRQQFDAVLRWTERPWQDTPSVYGPIASGSQWLASWLGGDNMHNTVFWLQMFAVIPFIIIGAVAVKMAHGNQAIQARATLFTVLNPLLIWAVVAGAHNEALCTVFAIIGLYFMRTNPFLAGVGIGMAGAVKVSLVFYGIAMVWGYRHRIKALLWLGFGALIPLVIAYGILTPKALLAAGRNTGYISAGTWSPWLLGILKPVIGDSLARGAVGIAGWAGMFVIGWMLSRVVPWSPLPGMPHGRRPDRDPQTIAVRTALVICTAWLITSPYTLSWYDLISWVPLALLMSNKLDGVLLQRGMWLSIAYVTGRSVEFSVAMQAMGFVMQSVVSSTVAVLVLAFIVRWWYEEGHVWPTWTFVRKGFEALVPRKA